MESPTNRIGVFIIIVVLILALGAILLVTTLLSRPQTTPGTTVVTTPATNGFMGFFPQFRPPATQTPAPIARSDSTSVLPAPAEVMRTILTPGPVF